MTQSARLPFESVTWKSKAPGGSMLRTRSSIWVWPMAPRAMLERNAAICMVVFLVLINQAQVGFSLRISFINRDMFNAFQAYEAATFWKLLLITFPLWAFIYIASAVIATFGAQVVDTFYVKDMFGLKLHQKSRQEALEKKLRQAIVEGAERAQG